MGDSAGTNPVVGVDINIEDLVERFGRNIDAYRGGMRKSFVEAKKPGVDNAPGPWQNISSNHVRSPVDGDLVWQNRLGCSTTTLGC